MVELLSNAFYLFVSSSSSLFGTIAMRWLGCTTVTLSTTHWETWECVYLLWNASSIFTSSFGSLFSSTT